MVQVNAIGDACPIPVIKTLHALQDLKGAGTVQTLVDNEIAVQNLTRLAESKGCSITTEKRSDKEFCVTYHDRKSPSARQKPMSSCLHGTGGAEKDGRCHFRRPYGRGR